MDKNKELAKNTIIIIIGKICTQFVSFFLLPLYTAYLETGDLGTVDLLNTYISLLVPIVTLQLENAAFRFLIDVRDDEEAKTRIITSVFKYIIIHIIVYSIIYLTIANYINVAYKYFLLSNVIVCILSSIMLQISRGLGDNKTYSEGSVIAGTLAVILNVFLIAILKFGAYGILISNLIANIICFLFILVKLKVYKYIRFKKDKSNKTIKEMYRYSMPMIPNSISWWIVNASDRTIISSLISVSANGIYSVANKFSGIFITIYNLFNLSWTESASMHINDNDRDEFFSNTINNMFKFFSSICIGIIACLPLIFSDLVKGDYIEAYSYIPILMVATLFNVVVGLYSVIYIAKKETKEVAKTSVMAAIINIVTNLLLVKKIGLYAAAFSTAIAYFAMMIFRYFDVKKYLNINIKMSTIISTVVMLIITIVSYYIKNIMLSCLVLFVTIIFVIVCNKTFIIEFIEAISKRMKGSNKNEN